MNEIILFGIGFVAGFFLGIIIMALACASSRKDDGWGYD